MKQFTMHAVTGDTFGPYALKEPGIGASFQRTLDSLAVGESCTDCEGDTWTRLPDVGDEPQSVDQARKERREHLASIAFAGLLARVTIMPVPHKDLAEDAIAAADALIAALDASE